MASAASPTEDLVMAAFTNGLLKFLWHPKWHGTTVQMEQYLFSLSVPENWGIPGILFKMG